MQNRLKLGFFIQPVHPPSRPYADVLREDREAVALARRSMELAANEVLPRIHRATRGRAPKG